MNTEATTELEELQDQARATVQLSQADRFTMNGHLRKKLAMARQRLAKTWGLSPEAAGADDDMQYLGRDFTFIEQAKEVPPPATTPVETKPPAPAVTPTSKWPLAAALALGLGVPGVAAVIMAPTIIEALQDDPPVVNVPDDPADPEYAPILLPGKPPGAK